MFGAFEGGPNTINAAVSSAGETDEAQATVFEPQRSVDDRDLTNVSPNEPARADSVEMRVEKAPSSPEPIDAVPASAGDIAASRELHAAFYDYRTLLICVVAQQEEEEGGLVQFADDVVRAYNGLEVRSLSRMAWKQPVLTCRLNWSRPSNEAVRRLALSSWMTQCQRARERVLSTCSAVRQKR